jgi:hypothetical protein
VPITLQFLNEIRTANDTVSSLLLLFTVANPMIQRLTKLRSTMRVMLEITEDNRETTEQDAVDNAVPSASRSRGGPSTILARNNDLDA